MATLPAKACRKEQRSVVYFLWAKGLFPNTIHSDMRPVYGDKCFTRPAIHVGCKKFARGRESVVDEKDLADVSMHKKSRCALARQYAVLNIVMCAQLELRVLRVGLFSVADSC